MFARVSLSRLVLFSATAALAAATSLSVHAQDATNPVRAARLTSSQGTVTVVDGNNPPVAAQMNVPLPAGVQIATGDDGQAEIEFEDGSIARLTPNTTLSLDRLDIVPGQLFVTSLDLMSGLAYFELRAAPEYTYTVNAGGDAISPVENATIRVNFDQPPASFAVLDGSATVRRADAMQATVSAGETLAANTNDPAHYSLSMQIAADSWDQWNADMDQQEAQQSADSTDVRNSYAGAQGYGWGDLDADGTWYNVPGQGQVWQPYAAEDDAGFDPYGNGAWVSYPGMGYLWASAYPWGWTPYRCGAWSYYDSFGWGWAPGAACGGFGWGFGGGYIVNIAVAPRGYRPVHVPVARPGPVRPVIPVRIAGGSPGQRFDHVMPSAQPRVARQFAGLTATPITPVHSTFVAGGVHGSLGRDFPIDRTTHAPAMGVPSSRNTMVYRMGQQPGQAPQQTQPTFQGQRTRGLQQGGPQVQTAPQQNAQQPSAQPAYVRPQQQNVPQQPQHTEPAHPSYTPPPTQPRQNFSPQPQERYTPPPAPRYSPPPAPRSSPPPPPPAPHVSSPPSNNSSSHK